VTFGIKQNAEIGKKGICPFGQMTLRPNAGRLHLRRLVAMAVPCILDGWWILYNFAVFDYRISNI